MSKEVTDLAKKLAFSDKEKEVPTLPELFERLGDDGWEMISHVVNQDLAPNGTTMHYYNFKREKL